MFCCLKHDQQYYLSDVSHVNSYPSDIYDCNHRSLMAFPPIFLDIHFNLHLAGNWRDDPLIRLSGASCLRGQDAENGQFATHYWVLTALDSLYEALQSKSHPRFVLNK